MSPLRGVERPDISSRGAQIYAEMVSGEYRRERKYQDRLESFFAANPDSHAIVGAFAASLGLRSVVIDVLVLAGEKINTSIEHALSAAYPQHVSLRNVAHLGMTYHGDISLMRSFASALDIQKQPDVALAVELLEQVQTMSAQDLASGLESLLKKFELRSELMCVQRLVSRSPELQSVARKGLELILESTGAIAEPVGVI